MTIKFSIPYLVGKELENVRLCLEELHLSGDGPFTRRCHAWLQHEFGASALLTHSCTAALEMAAILAKLEPDDEVIMPSFTFVSTANAFVLRGARPVFIDIRPDTLNIDERKLEEALSSRTKAIAVVHYAGVACEMDTILRFANKHGLMVIEDAAQALRCTYKNRPLGTFGATAALSFHETKNVVSGEGGALLINDPSLVERAHIIREKGTNRTQFLRRKVAKYEWLDVGSSYLPSDLIAAVLLAQLEEIDAIIERRRTAWEQYHEALLPLEAKGLLRRPFVPADAVHNGHIYYVILPEAAVVQRLVQGLRAQHIGSTTHYVPLHSAPAGQRFGRAVGSMSVTDQVAARLLRLPLHAGIGERDINLVIDTITTVLTAAQGLAN